MISSDCSNLSIGGIRWVASAENVMRGSNSEARDRIAGPVCTSDGIPEGEIASSERAAVDQSAHAIVHGQADGRLVTDSFVRPSFTLEQIRTFLIVASRQHVTNAARVLGLTQPAVSQQVQMLERSLGVQLLERVGRGVRLTDAGLHVAATCLLIMRSIESLEETAEALRGLERGSVEIGASQVTANYYLSRALTTFSTKHPVIEISVSVTDTQDVCERVAAGQLQCGLVDAPLPRTDLLQAMVATDEVIFVAHPSNPLAAARDIDPATLTGVVYLVWGPTSATEAIASETLGLLHLRIPKVRVACLEAARQAVLTDQRCITAMPRVAVSSALEAGTLVRLDVATKSRSICAVRRPCPASPATEAFWRILSAGSERDPGRDGKRDPGRDGTGCVTSPRTHVVTGPDRRNRPR
jgi:DNA-binding transcriptional LysR family regulator